MRRRKENLSDEVLEIWQATQNGIPVERARAYLQLCELAAERDDFAEALNLSEIAVEILLKEPEADVIADLIEAIDQATTFAEFRAEYTKQLELLEQGIRLSKNYQTSELPIFLRSMGRAYHGLKDEAKSVEYHLESMQQVDLDRDEESIGIDNLNLGMSYKVLENHQKAEEHLQIAFDIFKDHKNPMFIAHVFGEYTELYVGTEDSKKIKQYGQQALWIYQMVDDFYRQRWLNFYLAIAHRIDGELDDAIKKLELGRNLANLHGFQEFEFLARVDRELAKVYHLQGLDSEAKELEARAANVEEMLKAA